METKVVSVPGLVPLSRGSFDRKVNKLIAKHERQGWKFAGMNGVGFAQTLTFTK